MTRNHTRRGLFAAGLTLGLAAFVAAPATAQSDYPSEDITWVIPFSPGSGADTFARTLIKATQDELGVSIVPVNKEGGGTAVGVAYALSQPADGYTVFSQSTTLPQSIASGQTPFKADDIQGVARINADYKALAVPAGSEFETWEDFVAYAKENPGGIKIGGVGTKSWSSAFYNKLQKGADIEMTYVPYDGGSKVVSALLGENIDAAVITSSNINAQVDAGELRMLAISLGERAEDRPDVPTFKELGFDNIDDDLLWRGVFAKAGTPEEVLTKLNDAFQKATQSDTWKDYMERERQQSVYMGYEEFDQLFKDTTAEFEQNQ